MFAFLKRLFSKPVEVPMPSEYHPLPWSAVHVGKGEFWVYASNDVRVARILCRNDQEAKGLHMRLEELNRSRDERE